ncbi:hypothetical protein NX784_23565 [Massilia pinisoli]|uniref:Transmembrane protein n=1 Tax=Massilia pinisoli TaxID=1772194 RepID=A0ABT1ZXA8_9BURK|nr:hypothetical protein [Massilia pinisoli]MCS0584568.1 hypothetical protein [Massilia pinisoli]
MNSAFTHHHAETKAGRLARGVRLAALACALALGAGSAWAQQHGDRRDDQGMQQSSRFRLPPQDRDQRDDQRPFDEPRFEQRRAPREQREPQHDARRSSGRMTPDERRDLRRQINEAGMDLYPQRR